MPPPPKHHLFGGTPPPNTNTNLDGHPEIPRERTGKRMLDPQRCKEEWPSVRRALFRWREQQKAQDQPTDFRSFVEHWFGGKFQGLTGYPAISRLLYIIAVLPVGTAGVERKFRARGRNA